MNGVLCGKVCIIAGTTGIGAATAELFVREGARVLAVGRSKENADNLSATIGESCRTHLDDLASEGASERVLAAALGHFGSVDILFHVAGISGRAFGDGPLHECTDGGWDTVMDTNLRAMFQLNRACIAHWLKLESPGVILNMASVLGYAFVAEQFNTVAYASAKAAIIGMSGHAAATYAKNGIRVNVIAPSLVETPMAQRATRNPAILELLKRKQPLTGAPLQAEDCARAALFLCSDAARAVTGIVMPVDAGWGVSG